MFESVCGFSCNLSPSIKICLTVFANLSVCSSAHVFSVFLQFPLTVLLSLSVSPSSCFCPGLDAPERTGDLAPLHSLTLPPGPFPVPPRQAARTASQRKPVLFQIVLLLARGHRGIWGSLRAQEQLPRLGHCLQAWPFSLNGMLILYV